MAYSHLAYSILILQQKFICPSSGVRKSRVQVLADSVPGKSSFPGLQTTTLSLCPYILDRGKSGDAPSSRNDISPVGIGPHRNDLLNPYLPPKEPISKHSHIGGWGFNIWIWRGCNSAHSSCCLAELRVGKNDATGCTGSWRKQCPSLSTRQTPTQPLTPTLVSPPPWGLL